jgi:hypothetical protein
MALRTAATVAGAFVVTQVSAQGPVLLVPTALVEDVKSATAGVAFMDYVGKGQVIKLEPGDVLVLSYIRSCEHEIITGATVIVGLERSDVQGRQMQIVRTKVPCDAGKLRLSPQQAGQSVATAIRLQSADSQPKLYARTPVVQLPKTLAREGRTLRIERIDRTGERHDFKIDDTIAVAGFYDLAKSNVSLTPGATYDASIGGHSVTFQIDAKAKSGPAPIVSRLLRFQ